MTGEGHFLGTAQILSLTATEYAYPELGDRQSVNDWIESGGKTVWNLPALEPVIALSAKRRKVSSGVMRSWRKQGVKKLPFHGI
ncbi:hypothetical protein [Halocynthiibacter sp.]|uniref:hypothetical protein n=1 Tax=Halocynthiibacter sp. TaxID=1979210 RepID=UPI003C3B7A6D